MSVNHEAFRQELREALAAIHGVESLAKKRAAVISEAQATILQQLVRDLNAKHHAPFQTIWTLVNQHSGVPSYRLTPAEAFDAAAFYLQHWIDTGLPPAR